MRENLHVYSVRTSRFGLRSLNIEGGHLWAALPTHLKECSTHIGINTHFKANLISSYASLQVISSSFKFHHPKFYYYLLLLLLFIIFFF